MEAICERMPLLPFPLVVPAETLKHPARFAMKKVSALILGHIVVLGFLVFLMNVMAIASLHVYDRLGPLENYPEAYLLPNYQGAAWAQKHFVEINELDAPYMSYYGWRRSPYIGETINVDGRGLRRTYRDQRASPERTIAFFGGSTMWGSGADDNWTIPSEFIKLNPEYVGYNFGESGYVAHQSLNVFLEWYFEGFRPDVVVFYDGVNEVWVKCQYQLGPYSHWSEAEVRSTLRESRAARAERGATVTESVLALVQPVRSFIDRALPRIRRKLGYDQAAEASYHDCHTNPEKAEQVARVLLSDWLIVKDLVESYGGTFVPILQPVIYASKTRTDHLTVSEALGWQFETVYPLIVDLLHREFPELAGNIMDLRDAVDRDEYIYIDWCHLSPNGNQLVGERISQGVAARTDKALAARSGPDRAELNSHRMRTRTE